MVDDFVNAENTVKAITALRRSELEQADRSSKKPSDRKAPERAKKGQYDKRKDGGMFFQESKF